MIASAHRSTEQQELFMEHPLAVIIFDRAAASASLAAMIGFVVWPVDRGYHERHHGYPIGRGGS
jgi:hypothetical protein